VETGIKNNMIPRKQRYKGQGVVGLFDQETAKGHLSKMGNPLEKLSRTINFEIFRSSLEKGLEAKVPKKSKAGARPFDVIMLLKILILQRYYGLSDKQVEYQVVDRLSFKKFLGLESGDKVPDEKTIWLFREKLTKTGLIEQIFKQFVEQLTIQGMILNEGQIVDASFVPAPRQRNTREENKKIKAGQVEELWSEQPKKKSHKDIDARWTKKNDETVYGYKNHAKVDKKSKLINSYQVTSASVHDSQALSALLKEEDSNQELYADSAYSGKEQAKVIDEHGMQNRVHEKGYRNRALSEEQKSNNKEKSKIRARVEHVFGFMEQSMQGLSVKSVGIVRASGIIGLINLTYNLFRYEQIVRLNLLACKQADAVTL
jgi:IS5 family transposase